MNHTDKSWSSKSTPAFSVQQGNCTPNKWSSSIYMLKQGKYIISLILPSSSSSSIHLSQSTLTNAGGFPSCFSNRLHHFFSAFFATYTMFLTPILDLLSYNVSALVRNWHFYSRHNDNIDFFTLVSTLSNNSILSSYGAPSFVAEKVNFPSGSRLSFTSFASGRSIVRYNLSDLWAHFRVGWRL